MKKNVWTKITAVLLSFVVLVLAGCSKELEKEIDVQESEKIEVVHPLRSTHYGESFYFENENGWEYKLRELGYTGIETLYQSENEYGHYFIVTADGEGWYEEAVNTFAVFESQDSIEIAVVSESSILEKFESCEIDGNTNTEEFMLCFDYMGNGGAGSHETQIWNFEYGIPTFMFSSSTNFGYASALNDGYEVVIDNIYTDYQIRIDCKDNYEADFIFDENGKATEAWGAEFEGVYETVVKDVDNDGDGELICKSYSYLGSRANYLGSAVTTIDYNTDLMSFVIVDTEFVEPIGDGLV